jgi:hypothetical protein
VPLVFINPSSLEYMVFKRSSEGAKDAKKIWNSIGEIAILISDKIGNS